MEEKEIKKQEETMVSNVETKNEETTTKKDIVDENEVKDLGRQLEEFERQLKEAEAEVAKELKQLEEELKAVEREEIVISKPKKDENKETTKSKFEPVKKEKTEKTKTNVKREKTKKKKHRILKTFLMLIIVALVLFLINYARNYYIVSEIVKKQAELAKITNYSFVTEHYSLYDNNKSVLEHYHKDGKNILIKNGEQKIIIWNDENTKETIFLLPKVLKATIDKNENGNFIGNSMPLSIQEGVINPAWSFMCLISSEEVNGQECYKIIWSLDATTWIDKESGMKVKSVNGYTVKGEEKFENITEWKNIKLNELKEEDMSRPNLMGYDITENK